MTDGRSAKPPAYVLAVPAHDRHARLSYFLARSSTDGRTVPIALARALAFIVGETISPKLSLSNQAHRDRLFAAVPSWTHAALPPRGPALTTWAPRNCCVKLVIEAVGSALARWPPMNMMICAVL